MGKVLFAEVYTSFERPFFKTFTLEKRNHCLEEQHLGKK